MLGGDCLHLRAELRWKICEVSVHCLSIKLIDPIEGRHLLNHASGCGVVSPKLLEKDREPECLIVCAKSFDLVVKVRGVLVAECCPSMAIHLHQLTVSKRCLM